LFLTDTFVAEETVLKLGLDLCRERPACNGLTGAAVQITEQYRKNVLRRNVHDRGDTNKNM
jgi:hypothetical protein